MYAMRKYFSKQQFVTSTAAILLSVFAVAVVAYGASIMDTASVGSGTSTPGAALGVKGAGIFEDFVWANAFIGTSTSQASGFGTTSPGADFAVASGALFGGPITASAYTATSTTATSTIKFGLDVATSSLIIDGITGRVAIGTSTLPDADVVAATASDDPTLTIAGLGSTANATGTLYITGGSQGGGGQIILKSVDGTRCVAVSAATAGGAQDTGVSLTAEIVDCPR